MTHDLDTREHDRREATAESVRRWPNISSMISRGILGTVSALVPTEAGRSVFEDPEPIADGMGDSVSLGSLDARELN